MNREGNWTEIELLSKAFISPEKKKKEKEKSPGEKGQRIINCRLGYW
jgi:hypothetical protein